MSLFNTVTMTASSVTGSYTKGKWSETIGTPVFFQGTFQPLNGKEMEALPENRRVKGTYKVYTSFDLDTVTSTDNPDRIILNSVNYEIIKKNEWINGLIPHYKYIIQEVKSK